jgi:hypothetical protein
MGNIFEEMVPLPPFQTWSIVFPHELTASSSAAFGAETPNFPAMKCAWTGSLAFGGPQGAVGAFSQGHWPTAMDFGTWRLAKIDPIGRELATR